MLFGSTPNIRTVCTAISRWIRSTTGSDLSIGMGLFRISLRSLSRAWFRHCCAHPSSIENRARMYLTKFWYCKLFGYFVQDVISPLLRRLFFITKFESRLVYYRKCDWARIMKACNPGSCRSLVILKSNGFREIQRFDRPLSSFPNLAGFPWVSKFGAGSMTAQQLFRVVLSMCRAIFALHGDNKSVDNLEIVRSKLRAFLSKADGTKDIHIIKHDIANCFDRIDTTNLRGILERSTIASKTSITK